ncbi:MAG: cell division protein FtsA [Bacteroidia bacterium]|nr:cell division protein FtsA [Bacteroidia bacterium]MCZ2277854.1 cell division protein FtsA [Bacteroidia bacterium]
MAASEIIVGLDIGTTKICAIAGRRNEFGKIEILGMGRSDSFGVTRGVVANIDKTVASIKEAISEVESRFGLEIGEVHVGIAGQHIKSHQYSGMIIRNNAIEEISQKDIDAIVNDLYKMAMNPGEEIIDVIPQEFVVDNEKGIKDPVGMAGIRLEANCHIITGLVSAAQNINKCVSKAGLKAVDLVLESLASAEAVLSEEEKEAGVALIDVGGGTTDLAIFQDGIIRHTAVIPFGGNVITEDIKEGCSIIKSQAELLKVKFGSALAKQMKDNEIVSIPGLRGREPKEISVKNLAHIIQARMEEIIESIYIEIKNSGFERKLIAGIVITGGGAMLKHLSQLVEYMTGYDTRIGYPNEHLAKGNEDLKSPMYATAVGLVICGITQAERRTRTPQPTADQDEMRKGSWFSHFFKNLKEGLKDDTRDTDLN